MSNLTNLKIKDGDGEDENFSAARIEIQTVSNGWIMTVTDDEDMEYTEVYDFSNPEKLIAGVKDALSC